MLKVKCPAKINITLEILNKRPDGFHNIQSVMQTINLFDILTVEVVPSDETCIVLSGTSKEIPYDERNLVYKAADLFLKQLGKNYKINVHIEKNIPVAAGLAGGSTNAAGIIFALNEILEKPFSNSQLHELCAKLGSDLNFCLEGGCKLATSRGEILENLQFKEFDISLIKPKLLGISAKEAYTKFSQLEQKPNLDKTHQYINGDLTAIHNDLEIALIRDYEELSKIKQKYPSSLMSGSGSTFFLLEKSFPEKLNGDYEYFEGLKSIPFGVSVI